jgi:hypothetical protein
MSFLLDTNVVSEGMKLQPDPRVVAWLASIDEDRIFISVVTLTEVRSGIERMAVGRRRNRIEDWLQYELPLRFEGRILLIDATVADASGKIIARSKQVGRPIGAMDAFIAATAEVHHLMLVTRNESDFKSVLKTTLNPWDR